MSFNLKFNILNVSLKCPSFRSLQRSHLHWNLTSINSAPGRGIRSGVRSPCAIARRRYGLVKIQAKLCRNSMETMPHVQAAALLASETCRTVFKHRRWNCSSITLAPYLTPDLTRGNLKINQVSFKPYKLRFGGEKHHILGTFSNVSNPVEIEKRSLYFTHKTTAIKSIENCLAR